MADKLYGLLESQIAALWDAQVYATAVCEWVGRLFVGIRDDRLEVGPYRPVLPAIGELLDPHRIDLLLKRLETIGFLIEKVRIPVEVPSSGPFGENVSIHPMAKCPSAHRGAVMLWNTVHPFLSHKVFDLFPELGLAFDVRDAACKLVDRHWETLRKDLADVVQFDCETLKDAISRESQAAKEICNASLIAAVAGSAPSAAKMGDGEGNGGPDDSTNWITISGAARLSGVNKGVISRAADTGEIKTNGKDGRTRRLHAGSFAQWQLQRSPPAESTPAPEKVIERARAERQKRGVVDKD
jgi:hypothetical protein